MVVHVLPDKSAQHILRAQDVRGGFRVVGIYQLHLAYHHVKILRLGLCIQFFINVFLYIIVTVTVDYVFSGCCLHSYPAAGSLAQVLFCAKDLYLASALRIIFQHLLQDLNGAVRAAVVDEYIFNVLERLPEKAAGTPSDVLLNLVDKDYDADGRHFNSD